MQLCSCAVSDNATFVPSADPGVGIYVDGVYYARSIGSVLDIIDIDRI